MQMWRDKASLYPSSDATHKCSYPSSLLLLPREGVRAGKMEGRSVAAVAPDFFAKSTREFAILDDSGFLQTFKPPWATDSLGEGRQDGSRTI